MIEHSDTTIVDAQMENILMNTCPDNQTGESFY